MTTWSLPGGAHLEEGHCFQLGRKRRVSLGPRQFPATAVGETSLSFPSYFAFLYSAWQLKWLLARSKAGGPAELRTELGMKAPESPVTNSPPVSLPGNWRFHWSFNLW